MTVKKKRHISVLIICECHHDPETYLWHWEVFIKNNNWTDYKKGLQISGHKTGMHMSNHHAYFFSYHTFPHMYTAREFKHIILPFTVNFYSNVGPKNGPKPYQTCENNADRIYIGYSTQRQLSSNSSRPTRCFLV